MHLETINSGAWIELEYMDIGYVVLIAEMSGLCTLLCSVLDSTFTVFYIIFISALYSESQGINQHTEILLSIYNTKAGKTS